MQCTKCKGTEFDTDNVSFAKCCVNCGTLVESTPLVAEVEFAESGTTSKAIGRFVHSVDDPQALLLKPSQEVSVNKIRQYMATIGNQLSLTSEFVESALSFYRMALHRNLTRARRIENVAVACLYMCCRIEKTSRKTFLFLARSLSIHLPIVDPCLYIQRFGHKLNFGDKTHSICMTAVKLVSHMKRDWIHHGRRPSGLCGAALLVAARLHGVNRSVKQIVRVVRISSSILLKRLKDFSITSTALLTVDEFKDLDLSAEGVEMDPPAFIRSQQQAERYKYLEKSNIWSDINVLQQVSKTQTEIEVLMGIRQAIEIGIEETHRTGKVIVKKSTSKKNRKSRLNVAPNDDNDLNVAMGGGNSESNPLSILAEINKELAEILPDSDIQPEYNSNGGDVEGGDPSGPTTSTFSNQRRELSEIAFLEPLTDVINDENQDKKLESPTGSVISKDSFERKYKSDQNLPVIPDTEEINSDFDDFEIENCLLTPTETLYKKKMWEMENEEFLKERKKKREQKLEKEKFRKRRKRSKATSTDPVNPSKNPKDQMKEEILKHIKEKEGAEPQTIENSQVTPENYKKPTPKANEAEHASNTLPNTAFIDKILKTGKYSKKKPLRVNLAKALRKSSHTTPTQH